MKRRNFLIRLLTGTAALAVAPSICEDPWCGSIAGEGIIPHDELHELKSKGLVCDLDDYVTKPGTYFDYCNFSSVVVNTAIDDDIMIAAEECGREHGRRLNALLQGAL